MLGNTNVTVLPNGCRIATSAMPGVESLSMCFDAGTGGRCERASELGFSHFLEHMLFKGSGRRPTTRAISQPIEERGGAVNAYTSTAHTCFYAQAPFDAAPLVADVLGDLFLAPVLAPREIDRERKVVLEEIKMYHDDDAAFAADLAQAALWPGHPLGRPILGTPASLARATADSLRAYHRSRYTARGTVIAAAGKLEHERLVDLVRPFAERLPAGPAPRFVPAAKARPPERLAFERRETQQVQAVLSFRGIPYGDPRKSAMSVLSQILGRGLTSRLFMTVRERHGLVYSISSEPGYLADAGLFQVYAGIDPARSVRALALIGRELRRIAREAPGRAEVRRAIHALVGAQRMGGETSSSQMAWIRDKVRNLGRIETPQEVIDRVSRVEPDEVRALAAELFRPENLSLALVMPRELRETPEAHLDAVAL